MCSSTVCRKRIRIAEVQTTVNSSYANSYKQSLKVPKPFDWTKEQWSAPQLATYRGVSPSFVRRKIKAGLVQAAKGGALADAPGEREYYRVKRDEVKRVIRELPIPPTGETLGERLGRFAEREGKDWPYLAYACNQIVDLEMGSNDEVTRRWLVVVSTRPYRSHRTRAMYKRRGDEYIAAEIKLDQMKGVGPYRGRLPSPYAPVWDMDARV